MYSIAISEKLDKILLKIKQTKHRKIIWNKIEEITVNPYHYKPLRAEMKGQRRVHLNNHFVLTFTIDEENKKVLFLDYEHHDKAYYS